jgi:hypothetical protein
MAKAEEEEEVRNYCQRRKRETRGHFRNETRVFHHHVPITVFIHIVFVHGGCGRCIWGRVWVGGRRRIKMSYTYQGGDMLL